MLAGRISAGNGRRLAQYLSADDWPNATRWLAASIAQAQRSGAQKLLLSSEQLLAPLAESQRLLRLVDLLKENGIASTDILLIQRDPVDQLLSLYKHRAKRGTTPRIHDWVADGYRLPLDLEALRVQAAATETALTARAYTRKPGGLERLFFADWLEMNDLPAAKVSEVNPSLTLSELELLRQMNGCRPELVSFLYEHLLEVPRKSKLQGSALERHAHAVAERAVWQTRPEWLHWIDNMPEGETLKLPEKSPEVPDWPEELGFSEQQIASLADFMAKSVTPGFMGRLFWRGRLRPFLARVKRSIVPR